MRTVVPPDPGTAGPPCDSAELTERLQALCSASRTGPRLEQVLVPLDLTEASLPSLAYAALLARQFGCTLTLLHVVRLNIVGEERGVPLTRFRAELKSGAERALRELVAAWHLSPARIVVRLGEPAAAIVQEAGESEADLIILGRHHGRRFWRLLRPSIGRKVARRAPCPALIVS